MGCRKNVKELERVQPRSRRFHHVHHLPLVGTCIGSRVVEGHPRGGAKGSIDIGLTSTGGLDYYRQMQCSLMFRRWVRGSDYHSVGHDGMKIPVIFVTGQVGHIHRHTLDHLIREKEIVAFHRSEGWVQIGRDPIRNAQHPSPRSGNRRDDTLSQRAEH